LSRIIQIAESGLNLQESEMYLYIEYVVSRKRQSFQQRKKLLRAKLQQLQ